MNVGLGSKIERSSERLVARRGTSLSARLLTIALVPIIGMLSWAGASTLKLREQQSRAERVTRSIDRISNLLRIRSELEDEVVPAYTNAVISQYGVKPGLVKFFLGFDPDESLKVARARFEKTRKELHLDVPGTEQRLATARRIAAERLGEKVFDSYQGVSDLWIVETEKELAVLKASMYGFDGDRSVTNASTALFAAHQAAQEYGRMTLEMFKVAAGGSENRVDRRLLAASEALTLNAFQRIEENAGPKTLKRYRSMRLNVDTKKSFDTARLRLETPSKSFATDFKEIKNTAETFSGMLRVGASHQEVLAIAGKEAKEIAMRAKDSSSRRLKESLVAMFALTLFSVSIALSVARRISNPLKALARKAGRIGLGQLDQEPLPERGPREVTTVTRAVNDLESIIGTIDRQTSSLAEGNLLDDALFEKLPGRLGESIQATMERLGTSIRNREDLQDRLRFQATHDALTGLPNRKAVMDALDAALARGHRRNEPVATMFIDLDGFKRANDAHGHRVGDEVLKECSRRLIALMRAGDLVGRLGGDEFVVVCEGIHDAKEVVVIAERCIAKLAEPIDVGGKVCLIGASIGIAVDTDGTSNSTDLLRDADLAVYRAKELGRGRAEMFDENVRMEIDRRADLEHAIPGAIQKGELYLQYQPILKVEDSSDSRICSIEALIRWNRPGFGAISPVDFIPLLEASPRIIDIGRWVMKTALEELARFRAAGLTEVSMSVNLAARHLMAPSVIEDVRKAIDAANVPAELVVIEITETSLLDDMVVARQHLSQLRELGVRIAVDDFGTGFTSINQLGILPIDILKIDGSFVRQLDEPRQRSIAEMMIGVGATLGLAVVAEGVETTSEANTLINLGCSRHQGFKYDRPLSPSDLLTRYALDQFVS